MFYKLGKNAAKIPDDLINQITILDCSNCTELIELLFMLHLRKLICDRCTGLTELPLYPKLRELDCNDGSPWTVLKYYDKLKIGCEIHTFKEWEKFSDEEIDRMDPNALEFWKKNKTKLLNNNKEIICYRSAR